MIITSHFENIRQLIIEEINRATNEILIAVAWFTNHDIFEALLEKASSVSIKLVMLNDDVNSREDNLNFQSLIKKR